MVKDRIAIPALVSTAVVVCCVHFWSAIAGRWNAVIPIVATFATSVVAVAVLAAVIAGVALTTHRKAYVWLSIFLALLFVGTAFIANKCAYSLRNSEIAYSIDNGLVADCETVFLAYRNHPALKSDGQVRLFPNSEQFDSLPDSIRAFDPVYVTIESNPYGSDRPPNIGLCKNGFGGFHMGLRVFQTPPNIASSLHREPITPTIYLWVDET